MLLLIRIMSLLVTNSHELILSVLILDLKLNLLNSMKSSLIISLFLSMTLTSCIYKMDIEQGNAVDSDKVSQISLGQSKEQVKFLLGTPAINDLYHEDTWHYLKHLKTENGNKLEHESMIITFKDNKVISIDGKLE